MVSDELRTIFGYDDSYPTCSRTYATLCIYLPNASNLDKLTEKLGIQPSRTQVKGEIRKGQVREWPTAWFLESKGIVESKDVRRHINWLLDKLQDEAEIIQQLLTEGSQIYLSCFWESAVGHGGPMLDAVILKRIVELGIGITFDIYFTDDNGSSERDEPHSQ